MAHRWMLNPRWLIFAPLLVVLIVAAACGGDDDAAPTPTTDVQPQGQATPTAMGQAPAGETPGLTPTAMAEATVAQPAASEVKFGGIVPMHGYAAVVPRIFHRLSLPVLHGIYGNFSHVVVYDPETPDANDVVCDLCTDWEVSDDNLTYTFHLRENAYWNDGVQVTSRDITFSLDSIIQPDIYPIYVEAAQSIPSQEFPITLYVEPGTVSPDSTEALNYKAIDDFTFSITTKFPTSSFIPAFGNNNGIIIPAHKVLDEGLLQGTVEPDNMVTSGAFILDNYDREIVWRSRSNPNYYREGYPRIEGIDSFIIADKGPAIAAFKTEQVLMGNSALTNMNTIEMLQLVEEEQGRIKVSFAGPRLFTGVVFNTSKAPFNNVAMRRAVHYAVHRQAIINDQGGKNFLGLPTTPGTWYGLSPVDAAQVPGFRETADGEKHPDDIALANKILEDAGLGGELEIRLTARNCCNYPDVATIVADQLRRFLGWKIDLRIMESAAGFDAYSAGDVEFFVQASGVSLLDPDSAFDRFIPGGTFARWAAGGLEGDGVAVPGVKELYDQQQVEQDLEKRLALVREAENILLDVDNYYSGIYWEVGGWLVNSKIQGFYPHPLLYAYMKHDQIWCDPAC